MEAKKAVTLRLSAETIKDLTAVAKRNGVSQAQVVSLLVHAHTVGADADELEAWFEVAKRG